MAKIGHNNPPAELARVLIAGPTVRGTFFIYDSNNRVWDGADWRGFGMAEDYWDYQSAFRARTAAKTAAAAEAA